MNYRAALKAAKTGARLLDSYYGSPMGAKSRGTTWRHDVNPDALDMSDFLHCILAQLFGGYSQGLSHLGITTQEAITLGFHAPQDSPHTYQYDADNARLDKAWKTLLPDKVRDE